MRKIAILILTCCSTLLYAQAPWGQIYYSTGLATSNNQSKVAFNSEGTLYLAAQDRSKSFENVVKIVLKSYDLSQWQSDIWSDDQFNVVDSFNIILRDENNFDFLITKNDDIFIGVTDSIFHYKKESNEWISYYLPQYQGGLAEGDSNQVLFLTHEYDADADLYYVNLSKLEDGGTFSTVDSLHLHLPGTTKIFPFKLNRANAVIVKDGEYYVSVSVSGSYQNYYFKGNTNDGFTMLKEHFTHLNLSSMAILPDNSLIISYADGGSGGNPTFLQLKKYDFDANEWINFDTVGLNSSFCNTNQLKLDNNGDLYFTYQGEFGKGFLFKYGDNGWEHLGSKTAISTILYPQVAFGNDNEIVFLTGYGSPSQALRVFKWIGEDETSLSKLNASNVTIYPNPTTTNVLVEVTNQLINEKSTKLFILNSLGQMIEEYEISRLTTTIDLSELNVGVYYFMLYSNYTLINQQKVIVE